MEERQKPFSRTEAVRPSLSSAIIVANPVPHALDHVFTSRDLFRRRCLVAWAYSILATVCLLFLLIDVGLFVGLLADRGRLSIDIPESEVARFRELTDLPAGVTAASPDAADAPVADPAAPAEEPRSGPPRTVHISFSERGILPAVWRARNFWWGDILGGLFRKVELLQDNILGAITLLITGALLWTARAICLGQLRENAQIASLQAVAPLRRNVHRQALRLGPEDLDGTGLTHAREIFSVDIDAVRKGLSQWIEIDIRFPLELLCLATIAASMDFLAAAEFMLFLGIAWYYLESRDHAAESERQLATDRAEAELRSQTDSFQAARLVRGLGIEQMDHDHFANHLVRLHDLSLKQHRAVEVARHRSIRDIAICSVFGAFLLFLLSTHILQQQGDRTGSEDFILSIGGGFVFVCVWILAVPGTKALRTRAVPIQSARTAAERIQAYLDQIPGVSQAVGAKFLEPLARTLHFDSISYTNSSKRTLLKDLDLSLESGRTYAFISLDPLESRVLASMLPRFIEPQKGRILFDGEDIAWATLESLRAETIFVGANEPLLPGTVLDNIRGGRAEYTLQQATEAAKLTHAHNFIVKMFDGYESDLPDRADLMDVSQRFRLSLARAMIRNPALLIIEEPRTPLDEDTKALLADAYERICRDRTVIFLPGRLSTVRRCDQVIVLHEGRVAAIGPPAKLASISPTYLHWEYQNFNDFRHQES